MKKTVGITINGDGYKGLLDGLTEIKLGKKNDANRYVRSVCDAACWVAITAKDKNRKKWKFKVKRQTFEKFKTSGKLLKYIEKLKNQRLRRIARKTGAIIIKL